MSAVSCQKHLSKSEVYGSCDSLDRCAYTVLESLGRQIYLTDFEFDLLTFMEQRYGIAE